MGMRLNPNLVWSFKLLDPLRESDIRAAVILFSHLEKLLWTLRICSELVSARPLDWREREDIETTSYVNE